MAKITDIEGVGPALAKALAAKKITTMARLAKADVNDLVAIKSIGPVRAKQMIAEAAAATNAPASPKTARVTRKAPVRSASRAKASNGADTNGLKPEQKTAGKKKTAKSGTDAVGAKAAWKEERARLRRKLKKVKKALKALKAKKK